MANENVGDVNSDLKGSGARYNAGKPPMDLIPVWIIAETLRVNSDLDWKFVEAIRVLRELGNWQAGILPATNVMAQFNPDIWADCARVFDYGRKKYAEWNWAKGMKWSIPTACAVRHLLAIMDGEENDSESGLPHRGHAACNIVMLAQYESTFQEGDDRPLKWLNPGPEPVIGLVKG